MRNPNVTYACCCLVILSMAVLCGCSSQKAAEGVDIVSVVACTPKGICKWILPSGGGHESLNPTQYHIELEVKNTGRRPVDLGRCVMDAYIYAENGGVLMIRTLKKEVLNPGVSTFYPVNTDGYTDRLRIRARNASKGILKLSVLLWQEGKLVCSVWSVLPPHDDFVERKRANLPFERTDRVPDITQLEPGHFYPQPAAIREQGDNTIGVYTYCEATEPFRYRPSFEAYRGLNVFEDLKLSGISLDTEATIIQEKSYQR